MPRWSAATRPSVTRSAALIGVRDGGGSLLYQGIEEAAYFPDRSRPRRLAPGAASYRSTPGSRRSARPSSWRLHRSGRAQGDPRLRGQDLFRNRRVCVYEEILGSGQAAADAQPRGPAGPSLSPGPMPLSASRTARDREEQSPPAGLTGCRASWSTRSGTSGPRRSGRSASSEPERGASPLGGGLA